ncbi:MAG: hypothetical protein ACE37K_06290 [Planctomycetota bacterium]
MFRKNSPETPRVFVDGKKEESPHRYEDATLCMWHPKDPPEKRWTRSDGLLHLLGHIEAHLFKEEWWRESGEWLGAEAHHNGAERKEMHS